MKYETGKNGFHAAVSMQNEKKIFSKVLFLAAVSVLLCTGVSCRHLESSYEVQSQNIPWDKVKWTDEHVGYYDFSGFEWVNYRDFRVHVPAGNSNLIAPVSENTADFVLWRTQDKLPFGQTFAGVAYCFEVPLYVVRMEEFKEFLEKNMENNSEIVRYDFKTVVWKGLPAVQFEIYSRNMVNGTQCIRRGYNVLDPKDGGKAFSIYWQEERYEYINENRNLAGLGEEFLSLIELKE